MTFAIAAPWPLRRPAAHPLAILGAMWMSRPASRRRGVVQGRAASVAGVAEPFEDKVLRHLDAAYNLARYLTCDADAAEDVVQDAVLKAFRGFSSFRGGDAKAWFLTIVRREFIDWSNARRDGREVFSTAESGVIENVPCGDADAEGVLLRKGDIGAVRRAVEGLPEPFRASVILRDLEDLSYREVAQVTGAPIGTVMSRLARGRELLALALRSASDGATQSQAAQ